MRFIRERFSKCSPQIEFFQHSFNHYSSWLLTSLGFAYLTYLN
ncbi:hypothetical protein SMIDD26_00265 [Streptococcus mitis]|uniref:Uncharacterized protein n=1 Tax=Streptococcus mitis TaxID=28037 RepID=A0A139PZQ2_STRMT|nr:hypothetical protein SMIDD26_00265 [Streptococcus mitis]